MTSVSQTKKRRGRLWKARKMPLWLARFLGRLAGWYLKCVGATNRFTTYPDDIYAAITPDLPVIITMWHGEHFMLPFAKRSDHRVQVLISKTRDGEINAVAAEMIGMDVIRGSGGRGNAVRAKKKGGAAGLLAMTRALEAGISVSMTADVPRGTPKSCSRGLVTLARLSGRPILPVGFASTRFIRLNSWDRSVITLPFGRGAFVLGDMIWVDKNAGDAAEAAAQRAVEVSLNRAYKQAYEAVGQVPVGLSDE